MWRKVKKILKTIFATKMELILDDHAARLFINDKKVPLQIVYNAGFFVEHPEIFFEKLANELKRVIKSASPFSLVLPSFLLILDGNPEALDSGIIAKLISNNIQCRQLYIMRWSQADKNIGRSLEEVCREFPQWLKGLQVVKEKDRVETEGHIT